MTRIHAAVPAALALAAAAAAPALAAGDTAQAGVQTNLAMDDETSVALLQAFLAIDRDGNGLVSEQEWVEWQNWGDVEPPAYDEIDANDSGAISFMEYHNAYVSTADERFARSL